MPDPEKQRGKTARVEFRTREDQKQQWEASAAEEDRVLSEWLTIAAQDRLKKPLAARRKQRAGT